MECIIIMICPIPYVDAYVECVVPDSEETLKFKPLYFLSDLLTVFMFFKLHFMFRLFQQFSIWADAYTMKVQRQSGLSISAPTGQRRVHCPQDMQPVSPRGLSNAVMGIIPDPLSAKPIALIFWAAHASTQRPHSIHLSISRKIDGEV